MKSDTKQFTEIIDGGEEGYSLIFNPSDIDSAYDGHTWTAIIKKHCHSLDMAMDDVVFDSESDMFCVVSSEKSALVLLQNVIEPLLEQKELIDLKDIEKEAFDESDDDMTNADVVECLKESGIDMTIPRRFDFDFDIFTDEKIAKDLEAEILKLGFKPKVDKIDDEFYVDVRIKIVPDAKQLDAIEEKFTALSQKYGVSYIGYGF